jgi:hypothetical protein
MVRLIARLQSGYVGGENFGEGWKGGAIQVEEDEWELRAGD